MRAVCAATSSSSVRLADAGLAGEQDRGAGDQPAAEHPVELGDAARRGTSTPRPRPGRSGRPAVVTGPACARTLVTTPTSATEPQAWHSPQRPTHLPVSQPHSVQRYADADGLCLRHGTKR